MDDVLLFITNSEESIAALTSITETSGSFSGYKINFDKLMAMPIGYGKNIPNLPAFPFYWSALGF